MSLLASVFLSGWDWLWPALALGAIGFLFLAWNYFRAPLSTPAKAICIFLKTVGLLLLAFCLLEPLWSRQRAKPGANFVAVLADNSQGMQIKDRTATQPRADALRQLLMSEKEKWQSSLEENFQLRRYLFDARLQPVKDFSELTFQGRSTSLGAALQAIKERFRDQPLAAVLLFTDGNATDLQETGFNEAGLPPIYPVLIGKDGPANDLSVHKLAISQSAFEDAPVSIQTDVAAAGYSGKKISLKLVETGQARSFNSTNAEAFVEKVVQEQTLSPVKEKDTVTSRMQIRPDKTGIIFYRLETAGVESSENPEATLINNQRVLAVDRGEGPYRVLYVSGRPNWEFKFLNRAIEEDSQVQMVALIRMAKREPKFDFRGRAGESSNPLFRGFSNQSAEETERYDQPVIIRLNTKDEFELQGGFPKVAEDLYGYHAIILDDVEAEFFSAEQQGLLQKFVSERGGGLLALGGVDTLHHGKYNRTPVGDMLPVYLDQLPEATPSGPAKLTLTKEGLLQPWVRLRNTESDEKARLSEMPGFLTLSRVRGIKPGASVLAEATDSTGKAFPALAVQRFGRGRTAALMLGDVWRWGMRDAEARTDMEKAWRQLTRWLVADVPERVALLAEPVAGDPNQTMRLRVQARDKKFQPVDNATVTLTVKKVGASATNAPPIRLPAEADGKEAGVYSAEFVPREPGGFYAEAVVQDGNGVEVGRAMAGWTSDPAAEEFRSLQPNRALLETIARKTGGQMLDSGDLESFARKLPHAKVPVMENWTTPFWHRPAVFILAICCFGGEWFLRRWKGLP